MAESSEESIARYEARREVVPALSIVPVVLVGLALVSQAKGWEFLGLPSWIWSVLAVPALLACVDLWIGARGLGVVRTRTAALVLLGVIVAGNVVGLFVLVAALVTTSSDALSGGQLLVTAAAIWVADAVVFGIWFWELDEGGPAERARSPRKHPDFRFPQDEQPDLARAGWRPRVWDYLYLSLVNSSAFSPSDEMPLTPAAKWLMGLESVFSLVLIVLVTARAVSVLG